MATVMATATTMANSDGGGQQHWQLRWLRVMATATEMTDSNSNGDGDGDGQQQWQWQC